MTTPLQPRNPSGGQASMMVEPDREAGTGPVDATAVAQWMKTAGINLTGSVTLERVGLGNSNLTYRVTDDRGQSWVLRRPPLGTLLRSAHDVVREARIMKALEHTDVPVPRILGTLAPGEIGDEVHAVLMSWVDGVVVDTPAAVGDFTVGWRREAGLALVRVMSTIHDVDLTAIGLNGLASHGPFAPRQLRRWTEQLRLSRTRETLELDRLTERLGRRQPLRHDTALVHGDLHLRNVIYSSTTGTPNAVLDWELSTLGEPLADLGLLLACWAGPGEPGLEEQPASAEPGFPTRDEIVEEYASTSKREVSDLPFWHVLGLWKLAIIGEGVRRRALDEPRNKSAFETPTTERIEELTAYAHALAGAAGF